MPALPSEGIEPDSEGALQPIGLTLYFAPMGANLISGERSLTWYYVYLRLAETSTRRLGAIRTLVVIISSEPPDEFGCMPTPQRSFNSFDYLYVGSFFNNLESDIEPFAKEGNHVLFQSRERLTFTRLEEYPQRYTVTVSMPATSRMALLFFHAKLVGQFNRPGVRPTPSLIATPASGSHIGT